jgi:chemotaxis methyl-accepting protein methylase
VPACDAVLDAPLEPSASDLATVAAILAVVRERTGIDFAPHRPATLHRRLANRMMLAGVKTLPEYLRLLAATESEAGRLVERLSIKVSRFYRNPPVFDRLRRAILPSLARAGSAEPLRLWSAGCGRGEEAYTLAMLLDEIGVEGDVEATDIDASALAEGRLGLYPAAAAAELPADLRDRHLEAVRGERLRVREPLRRRVRFAFHDVAAGGPPAPRFHLVLCRNVLIYLRREAQERALRTLRRALSPGGVLCLGEAEWLSAEAAESLETLDRKGRIFRAVAPCRGAP